MSTKKTAMSDSNGRVVYTIGHSNHSIEHFVRLLKVAGITAVADVRSVPYSRRLPQFNRHDLKDALKDAGIRYVFLGNELGARPKDSNCYIDGRADYSLIASTDQFQHGLSRVDEGARQYRVALMCAEREPLDCHRTILVSRRLRERGIEIQHILADGQIEPHEITEKRLLKRMKLEIGDLFGGPKSESGAIEEAYDRIGRVIAYSGEHDAAKLDSPESGTA